jgi:hypothetical protein
VDDILITGCQSDINSFHDKISSRFKVGRYISDRPFTFNALRVTQLPDFSVTVDMRDYLSKCIPIQLCRERRIQSSSMATAAERTAYQQLAGTLNFLGHGCLPHASFVASHLQQQLSNLQVAHLHMANCLLRDLLKLAPVIRYPSPHSFVVTRIHMLAFSDASHTGTYGQTGIGISFSSSLRTRYITSLIGLRTSKLEWHSLLLAVKYSLLHMPLIAGMH